MKTGNSRALSVATGSAAEELAATLLALDKDQLIDLAVKLSVKCARLTEWRNMGERAAQELVWHKISREGEAAYQEYIRLRERDESLQNDKDQPTSRERQPATLSTKENQ